MRALAFGRTTGHAEDRICSRCGTTVRHVQIRYRTPNGSGLLYFADFHVAPCGGVCVIGEAEPHGATPKKIHFRRDCGACARLSAGNVQTSALADSGAA